MKLEEVLNKIGQPKHDKQNDLTSIEVSRDEFANLITKLVNEFSLPLSSLFATDDRAQNKTFGLHAILSIDESHEWFEVFAAIPESDPQYQAITKTVMAAHWYERYINDMFGITPVGHPDLRRLVNHENVPLNTYPLRKDFAWNTKMEHANVPYPMGHVKGEGIYEIPVGPIHAGIIEPGHFRFNVAGERIITLEGKLFFTHKGVEKLMEGKTVTEALPFVERLSGDMVAANALAYCEALEKISGTVVSKKAQQIRTLMVELERLTMHIHDIANIGGMGTGFSFVAANGFRIKERLMRLSEEVVGNRFWRGVIIPGGVSLDISDVLKNKIKQVVQEAYQEIKEVADTALSSEGFMDRLETTGTLPFEAAKAFGGVGLPVRASGVNRDVRRDQPHAAYKQYSINVVTKNSGDVHARFLCRVEELAETVRLIKVVVDGLEIGNLKTDFVVKDGMAIGAVESWRGEIVCAVRIVDGKIDRIFPRDPSFCNWALFAIIGPGNIVPDFPICNKSLNLSYSGTDM